MNAIVEIDKLMNVKISQTEGEFYTLQFKTPDGYTHWIDPFKTYEEAYDWWLKYYSRIDDGK